MFTTLTPMNMLYVSGIMSFFKIGARTHTHTHARWTNQSPPCLLNSRPHPLLLAVLLEIGNPKIPRCRVGGLRIMILTGLIVLMGLAPSSASWRASLRAAGPDRQRRQQRQVEGGAGWDRTRSLLSTRNPACTLPEADPCTLNTTAIGMVEAGYATYYDG